MNVAKIIFFGVLIAAILLVKYFTKGKDYSPFKDTKRPSSDLKPKELVENNKLVLISNVNESKLTTVLTSFCNAYNKDVYTALIQVNQIEEDKFGLTFPYNIDFITFSFLINFLYYPVEVEYDPFIEVWATFENDDHLVPECLVSENVIFHIPVEKEEYDNVYVVTEGNLTYKVDFGKFNNPLVEVREFVKEYFVPPIALSLSDTKKTSIIS